MAKIICRIFGVLFVAIGVMMIFRGEPQDQYHNLLHLATGIVALWIGFAGSRAAAKTFCLGFGVFYVAFGALGMALGDPAASRLWHVGPLHLDVGDHTFHLVLGSIFLGSGALTKTKRVAVA
jgi:hypothetical protein